MQGNVHHPSIAAINNGTAVHFGVKYFCTEPVDYSIDAYVEGYIPQGNGTLGILAGAATGGGVSSDPYVDGNSDPCANNNNSGWQPFDYSKINGMEHDGNGNTVTVGCSLNPS